MMHLSKGQSNLLGLLAVVAISLFGYLRYRAYVVDREYSTHLYSYHGRNPKARFEGLPRAIFMPEPNKLVDEVDAGHPGTGGGPSGRSWTSYFPVELIFEDGAVSFYEGCEVVSNSVGHPTQLEITPLPLGQPTVTLPSP